MLEREYVGRVLKRRKGLLSFHLALLTELGTVIDSTPELGVAERTLEEFADGQKIFDAGYPGKLPPHMVIERARRLIGTPYSLTSANCEHLVSSAHGLDAKSPQVRAWVLAGMAILAIVVVARSQRA